MLEHGKNANFNQDSTQDLVGTLLNSHKTKINFFGSELIVFQPGNTASTNQELS